MMSRLVVAYCLSGLASSEARDSWLDCQTKKIASIKSAHRELEIIVFQRFYHQLLQQLKKDVDDSSSDKEEDIYH